MGMNIWIIFREQRYSLPTYYIMSRPQEIILNANVDGTLE